METALRKEQVLAITTTVRAAYSDLQVLYLFGSAADGTLGHQSDIDIALVIPPARAKAEGALAVSDLRFRLEQTLGRAVDLVNAREAPVVLQKEIVARGTPIFVGDAGAFDEYEMLVLSRYGKLNEERREIIQDVLATGVAYRG